MSALWIQLPLVLGLGLGSWISAMDATGDPAATWILSSATAAAALLFLFKALR